MSHITLAERGHLRELIAHTRRAPLHTPVLATLMPELQHLLRADHAWSYRLAVDGARWTHAFYFGAGIPALDATLTRSHPRQGTQPLVAYNPLRPEPSQRNRVYQLRREAHSVLPQRFQGVRDLGEALGTSRFDVLRTLVCSGERLLAWVGVMREGEAFGARERLLLTRLVAPLQRRLRVERRLERLSVAEAALPLALEALPFAAFVLAPTGRVMHANALGLALREQRGRAPLAQALRQAAAGRGGPGEFEVHALPGRHQLVFQRAAVEPVALRLAWAARVWRLTARQREVLELLAAGRTNAQVAIALDCSESNVEAHMSALLKRAGCGSRAQLLARLWSG
jgi:DNA-binding CsgD family transcriptional regulator